jgi:hypothetical protein
MLRASFELPLWFETQLFYQCALVDGLIVMTIVVCNSLGLPM